MSRKGVVMDFRDGLSAELPAPRDDEPGSLRDDILDELADHLVCAYRRELLRGADAATANQRVLQRFGDPAALARRLWLDAMKGRIMSQRILVVCCVLLTMISLSLFLLMWNQAEVSRRLMAAELARSEADRQRAEAARRELLQKLEEMSRSAATPRSPDWIPVTFKLTQDTPAGLPAAGVQARLGRGYQGADKEDAIQRESDTQGMIDFGVIQPGDWNFQLKLAAKDGGSWLLTGILNALPGTSIQRSFVCPRADEPMVPVLIHVDWPSDLADKGLAVIARYQHEGYTYQPPLHWREVRDFDSDYTFSVFYVLCGPESDRVRGIQRSGPGFWQLSETESSAIPAEGEPPYRIDQVYVDLAVLDLSGDARQLQLLHGRNQLQKLAIVRPWTTFAEAKRAVRCELLAYASLNKPDREIVQEVIRPPVQPVSPFGSQNTFKLRDYQDITSASAPTTFEAKQDEPNVWTIHLPDELTRVVREKLKAGTK